MTGKQLYDALAVSWSETWERKRQRASWSHHFEYKDGDTQLLTGTWIAWPFLSKLERETFVSAAEKFTPQEEGAAK